MKVKFRSSLGTTDAKAFGVDKVYAAGVEADLPTDTVKALNEKYPGMFEEKEVEGVAAPAAIRGVEDKHEHAKK